MTNGEIPKTLGVNDHLSVFPAKEILPNLASMSVPNKHPLGPSVPAVGHYDCEAGTIRL